MTTGHEMSGSMSGWAPITPSGVPWSNWRCPKKPDIKPDISCPVSTISPVSSHEASYSKNRYLPLFFPLVTICDYLMAYICLAVRRHILYAPRLKVLPNGPSRYHTRCRTYAFASPRSGRSRPDIYRTSRVRKTLKILVENSLFCMVPTGCGSAILWAGSVMFAANKGGVAGRISRETAGVTVPSTRVWFLDTRFRFARGGN